MSTWDDLNDAVYELEVHINGLSGVELSCVGDALEELEERYEGLSREMGYVEEDLHELYDYRELGDITELERTREVAENHETIIENLKKQHENQRKVISALMELLGEVRGVTSEKSVTSIIQEAMA